MSEDQTQDLTAVEMLCLVLADVREMKARLGSLESAVAGVDSRSIAIEALVEDRFKDTRPIWQTINERTERIEARIDRMEEAMHMRWTSRLYPYMAGFRESTIPQQIAMSRL